MSAPSSIERALAARFRAAGDPEDARMQKAYMKSELAFHGVRNDEVRAAAKDLAAELAGRDHESVMAIADGLFRSRYFDIRSAAIALVERDKRRLSSADLPLLVDWVRRAHCWAHVDWISTLAGAVVARNPAELSQVERWAVDEDFWVRRLALLALLVELRKGAGDFALFDRIATPMVEEREFFIRKAIGWVLRETAKKRPELTFGFLQRERDRVSGLTLREGAKPLPAPMRKKLGLEPIAKAPRKAEAAS